jgi:hypothetical protein
MLPIDPGDGPGSVTPAQSLRDIVPLQAMAHGGTIIRPGAVAWGGSRNARDGGYSSCEVIERALAAVTKDPGGLPGLLTELAASRLWVPLPAKSRPFTDGAAVRLPLARYHGTDYVPCFTSVQRLAAWADPAGRAGDTRVVPHVVVPAIGLARRLPGGLGLALNPDGVPGLPLHPECVPYLARITPPAAVAAGAGLPSRGLAMQHLVAETGVRFLIGQPPAEPATLLARARELLDPVPFVSHASRAWVSVPKRGEGLVIAVTLDDPASDLARASAVGAIERAVAAVPLHVPFPVDVIFPGEPPPDAPFPRLADSPAVPPPPDVIGTWIARNARPFYSRD